MEYIKLHFPVNLNETNITLPSSKSISNRVLIIKALSGSDFKIENLSEADDTLLMKNALNTGSNDIFLKNAGTAMRFLTAYFATSKNTKKIILRGEERMHSRPIAPLVEVLQNLGAEITYLEKHGFPPLQIKSKELKGGEIKIRANISSQFVTALLLIAPTLQDGLTLILEGEIVSQPYIHLTLDLMNYFGVSAEVNKNIIRIPHQEYIGKDFFVESDWSAASYIYSLASIFTGTNLIIPYLFKESSQGDSVIKDIFQEFGLEINFIGSECKIKSTGKKLKYFKRDFIAQPDLIPTFVVLCCVLKVPFFITGSKTLKYKESDRAEALKTEMYKLGYKLDLADDSIAWNICPDRTNQEEIWLNTYNDHRLAMSFSLLSKINPNIIIENPDVVEKSYPDFWKDLEKLGIRIDNID